MAKSLTDIISGMVSYISQNIIGISTTDGTVVKDVVIDAPAQEFENTYIEIDSVKLLSSVNNYDAFTTTELDSLASDYGLERLLGTKSTGIAIFRFNILTDVSVPYGTRLSTQATPNAPSVSFITSQTVLVNISVLNTYRNFLSNFYEVSVPIESVNIGSSNNASANTIVNVLTTVSNLDSVINYLPTTGGTDEQTNEALAARIKLKREGNNIGTSSGYSSTVSEDNRVLDSIIVGPNDTEMLRNEYGGSIDIYILGSDYVQTTGVQAWNSSMINVVLSNQPVDSSSIVSVTGSVTGLLTVTTDYIFVKDTGLLTNSSSSEDKISFTPTGMGKLIAGGTQNISTVYSYNKLITDLQATINIDNEHILSSDILIREANEVIVNISADISILSGYDSTSIESQAVDALTTAISDYKLNDDLQPSDIVSIIYTVVGVDKVDLTTLSPNTDTIANKTQYLRPGTITITTV